MKTIKFKRATGLIVALIMAAAFMTHPLVVLADTYGGPAYDSMDEAEAYPQAELDPATASRVALFEMIYHMIPEITRYAYLTEDAREIALYDFDYFAAFLLATAPTRHMFGRLFGMSLEDYLDGLRRMIYHAVPVPSFTALDFCAERWGDAPTDARMLAADYLYTILYLFPLETGSFGHFMPQPLVLIEQLFFMQAYVLHGDEDAAAELLLEFDAMGLDAERSFDAMLRFHQTHYDLYNLSSVLWFYDIDPTQFDFDVDIIEEIGFMDEDNITTNIIEPGQIAYFSIASFMNNMAMDLDVLLPFFYEIQDYEHLIIDIRGNGGGFAGYFTALIVSMLIGESISFTYPEFFVAHEKTAALFENPHSLALANLYGVFPAAEFAREQNMTQFNQADLALLDYVAVWNVEYAPWEDAVPFGGKIWLLVDEESASASVMAAQVAVNTGFATVVGTPTSRVTGVIYTYAALPNTGILFRIDLGYTTDLYGRSIEEFGVIPQVANMPGMDALETVLSVIGWVDPDAIAPEALDIAVDTSNIRYIDGVQFVWLRYAVYAHGASVEWDGPNRSVIVTPAYGGDSFVVVVSEYGVFNDNGRVYVPVDNVGYVLADLLV